ncbi:PD-(D/E)XK motif protein [Kitasatospora sp. NPDC048194]|uniref:PD-(D/E)XK motif protein n=1 Tax=Kitasatospora sp. NPDC048194 TaxID=3364045 RepID=UPI00371873E1
MTTVDAEEIAGLFATIEQAQGTGYGSARRRLLPDSPLDIFLEVRFPGRDRALVIASTERIGDRDLVLANGLTCAFHDGHVEVVAQSATDPQIFCALLADLLDHLQRTSVGPAAAVVRRIGSWQRMLVRGLGDALGPEARVGLFGELLVLRDLVVPALGENALAAWQGPQGGPKDFAWAAWGLEVKSMGGTRARLRCRIHGEDQLDDASYDYLALVHQTLLSGAGGVSLPDLVDELRAHTALTTQQAALENNLLEAGWLDAHRSHYEGERWLLTARRCFRVTDGFPRVVPQMLPRGVRGVAYDIDLGVCADAAVDEDQVRAVLGAQTVSTPSGGARDGQ